MRDEAKEEGREEAQCRPREQAVKSPSRILLQRDNVESERYGQLRLQPNDKRDATGDVRRKGSSCEDGSSTKRKGRRGERSMCKGSVRRRGGGDMQVHRQQV